VGIALPAEGVFHSLRFENTRRTYPMLASNTMRGLWGMGQFLFTQYFMLLDGVEVHNTSEVLFRLCANTEPQRGSHVIKGPSDVLDRGTSEIASGSKLRIDATRRTRSFAAHAVQAHRSATPR
jgi:4-hydroxy-3-polyprenylbenzoate decarboxylase